MKLGLLILILLSSVPLVLQASQPPSSGIEEKLGIRPLIIFFDPHNNERYQEGSVCKPLESLWYQFKDALSHASAPILVSRNLWDSIATCIDMTELISDRWHIYASKNQSLIICIPREGMYGEYLGKLNDFTVDNNNKKISDGQFLLGIKLNLHSDQEITLATPLEKNNTSEDLAAYLKEILITYEDIKGWDDNYLNRWDMYLTGHGGLGTSIAGMAIPFFESLLTFLNKKIRTRSLLYNTCYAGGKNLKKPYQYMHYENENTKDIREKNFNFTVIATTTFEAATSAGITYMLIYISFIHLNEYFTALDNYFSGPRNRDKQLLANVIKNASDWSESFTGTDANILVPTIRFPNTEWFRVADIEKVFRLDDSAIMRAINQGKDTIVIPENTEIIILLSPYIPIPIKIEGDRMPLLVPQEHETNYYLKGIYAPGVYLIKNSMVGRGSDFMTMLYNLQKKMPNAGVFYIDKITMKLCEQVVQDNKIQLPARGMENSAMEFYNVAIAPTNIGRRGALVVARLNFKDVNNMRGGSIEMWYVWQLGNYMYRWVIDEPRDLSNYNRQKEAIKKKSMLPASMLEEVPQPVIKHPLKLKQKSASDISATDTGDWKKEGATGRWIKQETQK